MILYFISKIIYFAIDIVVCTLGPSVPFKVLLSIFPITNIYTLHFPLIFKFVLLKFLISLLCN